MTITNTGLGGIALLSGPEYDTIAQRFGLEACDPVYGQRAVVICDDKLGIAEVTRQHTELSLRVLSISEDLRFLSDTLDISPMSAVYLLNFRTRIYPNSSSYGFFENKRYDHATNTYTVEIVP